MPGDNYYLISKIKPCKKPNFPNLGTVLSCKILKRPLPLTGFLVLVLGVILSNPLGVITGLGAGLGADLGAGAGFNVGVADFIGVVFKNGRLMGAMGFGGGFIEIFLIDGALALGFMPKAKEGGLCP